ncbi:hypothetical protein MMC25_003547 [Agyrium rufum]|nr:hypothetical protein [Agyrium rufum]
MSTGLPTRQRSLSSNTRPSISSSVSSRGRADNDFEDQFDPCAATGSSFLFAQGSSIACIQHDTLALERRFDKHKEPIVLIAVDNVSEWGAGRLIVSIDAGQTAIVWDLLTGDEVARFESYVRIRIAAWMKNGHVSFGNSQGSVINFDPTTSEHDSARTIFDPITALAPATDCSTFAIGYMNGSILITTLKPTFTILHTLSTSRAPSPIINLAWHASSTKQKSEMLATQSLDGDLRVWSVTKPATADTPKVIRMLKRGDTEDAGWSWIAWSKNGRVIQHSEGETWAWDVRTKHVAYEPIPTIEGIRGMANYGPSAALFTIGPNHTVQQYDLSPPALVKTARHDPYVKASSVHGSQKSSHKGSRTPVASARIPGTAPPIAIRRTQDKRAGPASLSTIQKASQDRESAIDHARSLRSKIGSPDSTISRTESIASQSSVGGGRYQSSYAASGTTFSTFAPSMIARESVTSPFYARTSSVASSGRRSRSSRLRQEVIMSPEDNFVDLFPYVRARLSNMPFTQAESIDLANSTPDELRRHMLRVVFGWEGGDIEDLIRDEIRHHTPGSMNGLLLQKWLGEVNVDQMAEAIASGASGGSDWMLLALSQMDGQGSTSKLGQAFVQRLLQQGDIHTSATILLGMGDREDAVEVYVSRNYYMEAILLTCMLFPEDWQRQAHLVRRWGEFVVENSQQHLAIRCFSCTGVEAPGSWASPSQASFMTNHSQQSLPQIISPPTSPPAAHNMGGMNRMTAKNASLKLITSFGKAEQHRYNMASQRTDDRTPTNGPGITPIADSALSPGGTPSTFLRPTSRIKTTLNTPVGYQRSRLPSIGETPIDVAPPDNFLTSRPQALPTPDNSGSDREPERKSNILTQQATVLESTIEEPPLTLSSARYDPGNVTPSQTPKTAMPTTAIKETLPPLAQELFSKFNQSSSIRNGSRDRKPDGLHIQMPSLTQLNLSAYVNTPTGSARSIDHRRSNTWSARNDGRDDTKSPLITGQSWTSSMKSPSVSGRSIDDYISSLDTAALEKKKVDKQTRTGRNKHRDDKSESGTNKSRSRHRRQHREPSQEDRGRNSQRYIRPAKRSPSSPKPMSPEDLQMYRNVHSQSIDSMMSRESSPEVSIKERRKGSGEARLALKDRSQSKTSAYSHTTARRGISPPGIPGSATGSDFGHSVRSVKSSRQTSPNGLLSPYRGRSKSKGPLGSVTRSPSSPLPMSPQVKYYKRSEDEDDDNPLRLVEANRQRIRSTHRSQSRRPQERGSSSRRDPSPDRRRLPKEEPRFQQINKRTTEIPPLPKLDAEEARKVSDPDTNTSDSAASNLHRTRSRKTLKKEAAARELEARRESLSAKSIHSMIPSPASFTSGHIGRPPPSRSHSDFTSNSPSMHWNGLTTPPSQYGGLGEIREVADPIDSRPSTVGPTLGLPATPRAMRHPRYQSSQADQIPAIPEFPSTMRPDPFTAPLQQTQYQSTFAQTYATGQPMREIQRSMSVPIPESDLPDHRPMDMAAHPAFNRNIRGSKRPNFLPLGEIGAPGGPHRRGSSISEYAKMQHQMPQASPEKQAILSIDQRLASMGNRAFRNSNESDLPPPVLPELQHLVSSMGQNTQMIPPPPPPPPAPPGSTISHNSMSSGSGVGVINIVMDDEPHSRSGTPIVEVPPPPPGQLQPTTFVRAGSVNGHRDGPLPPPPPPAPGHHKMEIHLPPSTYYSHQQQQQVQQSPPPLLSPPTSDGSIAGGGGGGGSGGHRRGRSIDQFGKNFKSLTERMRSTSRGRNNAAISSAKISPRQPTHYEDMPTPPQMPNLPTNPYESRTGVPGSYF